MIYVIADDDVRISDLLINVLQRSGIVGESDEIVTIDNPNDALDYVRNTKQHFRIICDGFYESGYEEEDGPWIGIYDEYNANEVGDGFILFSGFDISKEKYEGLVFCRKEMYLDPLRDMVMSMWGPDSREGKVVNA